MAEFNITDGDLLAMLDVLEAIGEASDTLDGPYAARMRALVAQVKTKAGEVFGLLETRLMELTDGQAIVVDGEVFVKGDKVAYRPDWPVIRKAILATALRDGAATATDAAVTVVDIMQELYVSPSTKPKVGGLKKVGLNLSKAGRDEITGAELKVVKV